MPLPIDTTRMARYRHQRVLNELQRLDCVGCVLFDPVNIRYATGTRNMHLFTMRNPARYALISPDGYTTVFEFAGAEHLPVGNPLVSEVRPAVTASYVASGGDLVGTAERWASEIADLVGGPGNGRRLAVESLPALCASALTRLGFELIDAQEALERARCIKSEDEINALRASVTVTEGGVAALAGRIAPGETEVAVWSELHRAVIAGNGDYVETRLLNSGPRTFPWYQEASDRVIGRNELVALDTDVVGVHGYYCDFSRTFFSGPGRPSVRQRNLYRLAWEQIQENIALLRPGLSFFEFADQARQTASPYYDYRYYLLAHGVGMTGEYPYLEHRGDRSTGSYDGVIQPGMTLSVESYVGDPHSGQGIKLEDQVLVTEQGIELMTRFPFDDALLSREV